MSDRQTTDASQDASSPSPFSAPHSSATEYLYDANGLRTSSWNASTNAAIEARIYADGSQIAFRASDGQTYFNRRDWVGTERVRTNYQGQLAALYTSLPYGDGFQQGVSLAPAAPARWGLPRQRPAALRRAL